MFLQVLVERIGDSGASQEKVERIVNRFRCVGSMDGCGVLR